ncbi:asparagine synthetase B family protein [Magnetospirillum molischianum]|uniref:Asparagine synthetase domain-containing protein n=1 Tax=Magnetospirillum molischianum DSM 120 TaxID=1150626 RepID=H8FQC8_MAGML|nr:hypothetical protein [Magnetospirillum molischianum]CCG40566.1 hypothetical protein PHAMO_210077 [Magnetospirillum molischianum DSM 120]
MGVFILAVGPGRADAARRADAALVAGGLALAALIETVDFRLSVFRKLNGEGGTFVSCGDGDFACCTGTLIKNGLIGAEALAALWAEFDPDDLDPWKNTQGHWCAVLRKRGRVHVINDRLNVNKIYHDGTLTVLSNAFVALCEMGRPGAPNRQGCYEYVWNGVPFGTKTLFDAIVSLPNNAVTTLEGGRVQVRNRASAYTPQPMERVELDDIADVYNARLRGLFRLYARHWPRQVSSALSGGYDSRLLLALLHDAGMEPSLFVYGAEESSDVRVAKAVSAGEGLALRHIDKAEHPRVSPSDYAALMARNVIAFDGWKTDGLFDGGADLDDRRARSANGQALMNGSVGEIFRNFYYMRDTAYSLRDVVWTFYSRYDPAACTEAFSPRRYEDNVIAEIAQAVGLPNSGRVPRPSVEMIYPLFRGRYWTARDTAINQRFGTALYPYLEPSVFDGTWDIPLDLKNFGRLEGRMIQRLSPSLASHTSNYGFDFTGPVPWRYRVKMTLNSCRPPWMRRLSYRHQWRRMGPMPYFLGPDYLSMVIDTSFPFMRQLFRVDRVHDAEAFNRLCTVEYLCQRYGAALDIL